MWIWWLLLVSSVNHVLSVSLTVRPCACRYTSPTAKSSRKRPSQVSFVTRRSRLRIPAERYRNIVGNGVLGSYRCSLARRWRPRGTRPSGRRRKRSRARACRSRDHPPPLAYPWALGELGPGRGYHHYEHLADYQLTDYIIYNLFPNSVITVGPDGVQLLRPRPHATDPTRCEFDHWWLVPRIGDQQLTPSPAGGPDLPVEDAPLEVVVVGEK